VAFIDHTLYALEAGAGCSHALKGTDNLLRRVNHNAKTTQVADLSEFLKKNPVVHLGLRVLRRMRCLPLRAHAAVLVFGDHNHAGRRVE